MNPREIADLIANELEASGAAAAVLMGSHARGDALPHSDIDLVALGDGPVYRLERREEHLVAVSWSTPEQVERDFLNPARAGATVQGWRDGIPLIDPTGEAGRLRERALAWNWSEIGNDRCNAYVAEEWTGYAEEVHKLVNLLDAGQITGAAVQRGILSLRLAVILSVHLRLLYASENDLWRLVGAPMVDRWRAAQSAAFGLEDVPFLESCHAALELYRIGSAQVRPLLDARQSAVVSAACALRPAS